MEKDWHAIRLIAVITRVEQGELRPVFAGGTSLSKAYGIIQRFSEDLDFKLHIPGPDIGHTERRRYRTTIIAAIRADSGWTVEDKDILVGNERRFFRCLIGYPANFLTAPVLRPNIRLEMTLSPPALATEERSLQSFVSEARMEDPEVPRIACVAPTETAADKFSALTWRVINRRRNSAEADATLIRHLHDLAALEAHVAEHPDFPDLLKRVFRIDASRADPAFRAVPAAERVQTALEALSTDPAYRNEYERFVGAMCYGTENEIPDFQSAIKAVRRLRQSLL